MSAKRYKKKENLRFYGRKSYIYIHAFEGRRRMKKKKKISEGWFWRLLLATTKTETDSYFN